MRKIGIAVCTFWSLTFLPVQLPAFLTLPDNCHVTQTWEDGSKRAHCEFDYDHDYVFDPDGQPYLNSSGVPVRLPGFWYSRNTKG
jgi:hypothetical protein